MVRAKFKVSKVEIAMSGPEEGGAGVTLFPVVSGSPENEEFYTLTPSGTIILGTINAAAAAQFEVGKEYYVDFTPA